MRNSVKAVNASKFGEHFVMPLYESYCFSNIPATIQTLLGVENTGKLPLDTLPEGEYIKHDKVVLFFVDAFGYRFFDKYKDKYPSLQRFINKGTVSKITSQFPSTTAAHVTAVNTGLTVGESGVYEWFYYEPKVDAVIAPLLFSFAKDRRTAGTLSVTHIDPKDLYPNVTVYEKLNDQGIKSNVFTPESYAFSPYNSVICRGAKINPYAGAADGLAKLSKAVIKENGYFFFYYDQIDSKGHDFGPESPEFEHEIDIFFNELEKFMKSLQGKSSDTIILLTADHGQNNVDPKTTFYLDREIEGISEYFKTTKSGEPIVPAGSCRDMFLHVREEKIAGLKIILSEKLEGKAEIYETKELIEKGFFGKIISDEFVSRVGNMVILPYSGETVYWWGDGVFEQKHLGHHGGLTRDEMEIPFLALKV